MYVQQWQSERLKVCGVAVDSQATLARVRRVLISAYLLGVIQLAGGGVRMDGVNVVVTEGPTMTDTGGREYELRSKTAQEAKKWAEAVQNNITLAADEDDDE